MDAMSVAASASGGVWETSDGPQLGRPGAWVGCDFGVCRGHRPSKYPLHERLRAFYADSALLQRDLTRLVAAQRAFDYPVFEGMEGDYRKRSSGGEQRNGDFEGRLQLPEFVVHGDA